MKSDQFWNKMNLPRIHVPLEEVVLSLQVFIRLSDWESGQLHPRMPLAEPHYGRALCSSAKFIRGWSCPHSRWDRVLSVLKHWPTNQRTGYEIHSWLAPTSTPFSPSLDRPPFDTSTSTGDPVDDSRDLPTNEAPSAASPGESRRASNVAPKASVSTGGGEWSGKSSASWPP